MLRVLAEGRDHGPPALGVGRIERRNPCRRRVKIFVDTEPSPIGKRGGETMLGADEVEAVGEQAIFMRGKKWRAGKHAQVHGVKVVAKARPGDFAGLHRAAGNVGALDDGDLPAFGGEMDSGRKPIDAGADHDCIATHSFAPVFCRWRMRVCGSLASADISYLK